MGWGVPQVEKQAADAAAAEAIAADIDKTSAGAAVLLADADRDASTSSLLLLERQKAAADAASRLAQVRARPFLPSRFLRPL